jgi:hypothetical protein
VISFGGFFAILCGRKELLSSELVGLNRKTSSLNVIFKKNGF